MIETLVVEAKAKRATVTLDRVKEAIDAFEGWCRTCKDFTVDGVEGDYHCEEGDEGCPVCDGHRVVGAEDALMMGLFDVAGEVA